MTTPTRTRPAPGRVEPGRAGKLPLRLEATVQRESLAIMRGYGIDIERRNTRTLPVVGKGGKLRPMHFGKPGDPDASGMLPDGRCLMVEFKREGWRPEKVRGKELERWRLQLARLRRTNEQNGVGIWVDEPGILYRVIPLLLAGWRVDIDEDGLMYLTDEPRGGTTTCKGRSESR